MSRRLLLLGHTGKMGRAIARAFAHGYEVVGLNSASLDATDPLAVAEAVHRCRPQLIVNTVAQLGIGPCERDPERAYRLNALLPRLLAEEANRCEAALVHISTDAVFADIADGLLTEASCPGPVNGYGITKYAGDCFVASIARRHYIARISVLFGESVGSGQFVERMLARAAAGEGPLRVADDVIASPTYAADAAARIRALVEEGRPYGLYHVANDGVGSLYELMAAVIDGVGSPAEVLPASHRDFPAEGRKNLRTPIATAKLPPLRPWREAVAAYCRTLSR